ncbi:deoxyuridine 5'-triphosphate nucleotidohydrolase, mitochondrial isoform X1 [Bos taurus]|uniref:deoxyuridine 5'-triphosphate nucleotidohydrolase, mitochondrial isoform X1 n=1 Tax=Bos taurus TaxID=9913 RepID=UPI0028CBA386|nr:deoxyuridine 5'-triphosphate nucleotidohydrolase, mitochondrial isoform X1 [Bos taurus]
MTSLCPRPVLGHHFIPSLLRSRHRSSPPASGPGPRRLAICASALPGSRSTPQPPPRGPRAPRATTCTASEVQVRITATACAYDYTVPPMEKVLVKTDIQIALPSGCYGRVAPRSGLAAKHFIDVGAGVIDEDYRGNVGVVLFNFGKEKFEVKKGDRIAQLICERIFYPEIEEVQVLDDTERGSGGFGSTGSN